MRRLSANKDGPNVLNLVGQKGAAQSIRNKLEDLATRKYLEVTGPDGGADTGKLYTVHHLIEDMRKVRLRVYFR